MEKLLNSLKKLNMKQKRIIISVGLLLIISLLVGISYSYYLITLKQEGKNIISSACFKVTLINEKNDINLDKTYPISEEDASKLVPYEFTIKNVCDKAASYQVNLETLDESTLETAYLRNKLDENTSTILGNLEEVDIYVNENAKESRKLSTGILLKNEEVTYKLKVWVDNNSTVEQSSDKNWIGKVVVISTLNKNPYRTLSLNPTGGSVTPTSMDIVEGRVIGELPMPERHGYIFNGWFDNIEDGQQITETTPVYENQEIYAHWNKGKYELSVNPAGGTWNTFTATQRYQLEYQETMEMPEPTMRGHHFTEWTILGNDTTVDNNILTMGYENSSLVANYERNTYKLTVDPDGGEWNNATNSQDFYIEYEGTKDIPNPSKEGYTFTGWNISGQGSTVETTTFNMGYEDTILKATWEANDYPYIAYHYQENINDDEYTLIDADTESGELPYGTTKTPEVKNYTGFISPQAKTITIQVDSNPPVKNKVEYNYNRNKSKLTIIPNGGKYNNSSDNTTINNIKYQKEVELQIPERDRYVFQGWNVTGDGSSVTDNVLTFGYENTTLVANWKKITHIITFNANGGTVDPATIEIDDGSSTILPTPIRTDYRFDGWFTEPTGGTQVTNSTQWIESKTIYAHWTLNVHTITYNANGGTVSPTSATVTHGYTLNLPTPTRQSTEQYSYTFAGWYTDPTGGTQVTNSTQWTSSQTIYAHWTSTTRTYTITVRNGIGSGTYAYGATPTINAHVPEISVYYNGTCSGGGPGRCPATIGVVVDYTKTTTTYSWYTWSDGNTNRSRTITVTGDAEYNAIFTKSSSTKSVSCLCEDGSGSGSSIGQYYYYWSE